MKIGSFAINDATGRSMSGRSGVRPTSRRSRGTRPDELGHTDMTKVIFGTGAIGLATLDALRRRGETVRLVNRSGTAPVGADVEILAGDAADPGFAIAAARGDQVVYRLSVRPTTNGSSGSRSCRRLCSPPHNAPAPA